MEVLWEIGCDMRLEGHAVEHVIIKQLLRLPELQQGSIDVFAL